MQTNHIKNHDYVFHSEALRVFNALGSLLLWELELRWGKNNKTKNKVSKARAELLFAELKIAQDDGGGDPVKTWRRWRAWFSKESSFASGKLNTAKSVLNWAFEYDLLTQDEVQEFVDIFVLLQRVGEGDMDSYDMDLKLPLLDDFIWRFSQIEPVYGKDHVVVSYNDLKLKISVTQEDLDARISRSTRPDDAEKRHLQLQAALEAISSVGTLFEIAYSVNPLQKKGKVSLVEMERRDKPSQEKNLDCVITRSETAPILNAPSKSEIKFRLNELGSDAETLVEMLNSVLRTIPGPEKNIQAIGDKALDTIIRRMKKRFLMLQKDEKS